MATTIFRVEKNKNFTVISNHHLRDKNLSLKAKGLLTLMLSFSDDWDYTLNGLVAISKDGIDATRTTLDELEKNGYLKRQRSRNALGQLQVTEYTVYEHPFTEENSAEFIHNNAQVGFSDVAENDQMGKSNVDKKSQMGKSNVDAENTHVGKSNVDDKSQVGKSHIGKSYTGKSDTIKYSNNKITYDENNHLSSNESSGIVPAHSSNDTQMDTIDRAQRRLDKRKFYTDLVKENIGYDTWVAGTNSEKDFITLVVEVILDVLCSDKETITINQQQYFRTVVESQLLKLDEENVAYVYDSISNSNKKILNIRSYILSALYNSLNGSDIYYQLWVKSDQSTA